MNLEKIFNNVEIVSKNVALDTEITNIFSDSREVQNNSIFFALGKNPEQHIVDAINFGAVCIVVDEDSTYKTDIPVIVVKNIRMALGRCLSNFYMQIEKKFHFIGVVGTNGKTSTTMITKHLLEHSGKVVATIGTLGFFVGDEKYDSNLTTPDSVDFYKYLNICSQCNVKYVIMEVSAHAIFFKKTYPIVFDIGIFTNCTQDHLDFFENMENYSNTKFSFFNNENVKIAVVNTDDKLGVKMLNNQELCAISYGIKEPCDNFAIDMKYDNDFTSYYVNVFDEIMEIKTYLKGEFNVYNMLASITVAKILGITNDNIIDSIKSLSPISGRYNTIGKNVTAVIDYAHTPDSLLNIIMGIKTNLGKDNMLITIFGCGGNRDKTKRPIMGKIVGDESDFTIITSDNPRFEEPEKIMEEIEVGIKGVTNKYLKIVDREKAINFGIRIAKKGDIVLIAGKGAEEYIDKNGVKEFFSDSIIAQNAIRRYHND